MTLAATQSRQENNFGFVRLLFAIFVIVTHAYELSGAKEDDLLNRITAGQMHFSWLAVKGFFVISGFLIFQSLQRSRSLLEFYWKRILRLFPALAAVLILTVVFGPFVYEGDTAYLLNKSVQTYIGNNLSLYKVQYGISGIFENNPYKSVINGSLWTIAYEFTMYLCISALFFIAKRKRLVIALLAISYLILAKLDIFDAAKLKQTHFQLVDGLVIELGVYFAAGSLLASCKVDTIKMKYINISLLLSLLIMILSIRYFYFGYIRVLIVPIVVIIFCLRPLKGISTIQDKIGDLSYGMYIYGFPVQQALVYFFALDYLSLMFFSILISLFFAYFSWRLIEERALKIKNIDPTLVLKQLWKMRTATASK